MALMLRCVWLSCLLAGCAVPGGRAPAPALEPFVAASRFVPDGMKSFAFLRDFPAMWPYVETARRQVWAGRDFEAPDGPGSGACRLVSIIDFGTDGIDAATLAKVDSAKLAKEQLGTQTCWHIPREPDTRNSFDAWFAICDDRFVVLALHRDDLVLALERRGELSRVLTPFGDLSFLPADATDLVFSLPRPEELDRWGRMPPLQPMVFTVGGEPRRAAMFSKSPPHPDFTGTMSNLWSTEDPPVQRVGDWLCQVDGVPEQRPAQDQWLDHFAILMLFGFRIFI
jgi:hypothetical protein